MTFKTFLGKKVIYKKKVIDIFRVTLNIQIFLSSF